MNGDAATVMQYHPEWRRYRVLAESQAYFLLACMHAVPDIAGVCCREVNMWVRPDAITLVARADSPMVIRLGGSYACMPVRCAGCVHVHVAGTPVRAGLSSSTELNGQAVQISRWNKTSGRYSARLLADNTTSAQRDSLVGCAVVLRGLKRQEMNGRHGEALSFNEDKRRYAVRVDGDRNPVLLKSCNLSPRRLSIKPSALEQLLSQPIPQTHDPYTQLGLHGTATSEEADRAFRKRALLLHPDKVAGGPAGLRR